jgi:single-strand DNA-binding protein
MSFNKVILVGRLGKDPELRYTPQGTPVCDFSVATGEKRKDQSGEWQEVTTWFRVTFWGRQAETASQYLVKGRQVYIEGRLRISEWTDRDGKNRTTLEVHGTEMHFIDSANADSLGAGTASRAMAGSGGASPTPTSRADDDFGGVDDGPISDEEIPF